VRPCADPHTGLEGKKTVVLADETELTVSLPDLGPSFGVAAVRDGAACAVAKAGRLSLAPGDYVLARGGRPTSVQLAAARDSGIPPWYAPKADPADAALPAWPQCRASAKRTTCATFDDWNFFDVDRAVRAGAESGSVSRSQDDRGRPACRYRVDNFRTREAASAYPPADGPDFSLAFPDASQARTIVLTGRAVEGFCERVELAFRLDDGQVWGTVVTLPDRWADVRVPVSDFSYFSHWDVPPKPKDARLDMTHAVNVCLCFGRWLDPAGADRAHGIEISSVRIEN